MPTTYIFRVVRNGKRRAADPVEFKKHGALSALPYGAPRMAGIPWTLVVEPQFQRDLTRIIVHPKGNPMNSIVYIVGAVVIIVAILSFFGLR